MTCDYGHVKLILQCYFSLLSIFAMQYNVTCLIVLHNDEHERTDELPIWTEVICKGKSLLPKSVLDEEGRES